MNPPLDRLRDIVLAASGLPKSQRSAYLDEACVGDAVLRDQAERLLAADTQSISGMESGLAFLAESLTTDPELPTAEIGQTLGPYHLERLLGAGGSGTVYEAFQTFPVKRRVAIKLLHRNRPLSSDLTRFRAEQQILARLDHPNIAKVYDAGTTSAGVPYFVLELVEGEPITSHTRKSGASFGERLDLCLQACRAAEHAHAKGVIHRDLKPNNILVSPTEGGFLVKVIDFGIARFLEGDQDRGLTLEGLHLGTPEYMSPEQAGGSSADCDVKSDVHALGNLIQEVICGKGVYNVANLSPSSQLRCVAAGKRELAVTDDRGRKLPSDLRRIIAMATDPDQNRRYPTAAALAEDLVRFRSRQPVAARKAGPWYLLRKAAERHPYSAVLLVVMVAVVFGSLITLVNLNAREREAVRRAEAEVARNAGLTSYLQGMMESANPSHLGPRVTMVDAFADAARRAEIELHKQPDVLFGVLKSIAGVEGALDRNESALQTIDRAEAAFGRSPYGTDADRLDLRLARAGILAALGRYAEADSILIGVINAAHGEAALARIEAAALTRQAFRHQDQGRFAAGDSASLAALELLRAQPQPDRLLVNSAVRARATCICNLGQPKVATDLLRAELAFCEQEFGPDHPLTISSMADLAYVIRGTASGEKLELNREVLARATRLLGADHLDIASYENNFAVQLSNTGQGQEALPHMEHAIRIWESRFGRLHPYLAAAYNNLGFICHVSGDMDGAAQNFRIAIDINRQLDEPGLAAQLLNCRSNLATSLQRKHALVEAEAVMRQGLTEVTDDFARHNYVAWAHYTMGSVLLELGRLQEAEEHFNISERINHSSDVSLDAMSSLNLNGLGCARADQDWEQASRLLAEAESWLLGDDGQQHRRVHALLRTAKLLAARGESTRAALYQAKAERLSRPAPGGKVQTQSAS